MATTESVRQCMSDTEIEARRRAITRRIVVHADADRFTLECGHGVAVSDSIAAGGAEGYTLPCQFCDRLAWNRVAAAMKTLLAGKSI